MIRKNNKNKNKSSNNNSNNNSNYYYYHNNDDSNNSNSSNNNNFLKRKTSYSAITTIIFIIVINICSIVTFLDCYGYASSATQTEEYKKEEFLSWINDSSEIELDNKIRLLNFFKVIKIDAENNKAYSIIHGLAGNPYHNDDDKNNSSRLLSFLDTMPNNTPIKTQILSDLNRIADLAKVGNTKEIVSLIAKGIKSPLKHYNYWIKKEQHMPTPLPSTFPIDRKDNLIRFFKRMDNDITGNSLHYLFDIYEAIANDNDIIEADNLLNNNRNNHNGNIYSLKSSILNLEDFGAGYRSFDIWLNELNNLLGTFNLKDNKPRINELLGYVREANVSYFRRKATVVVPNYTLGIDIASELLDNRTYTIQKEGAICITITTKYGGAHFTRLLINNVVVSTMEVNSIYLVPMISGEFMVKVGDLIKVETDQTTNLCIHMAKFFPLD